MAFNPKYNPLLDAVKAATNTGMPASHYSLAATKTAFRISLLSSQALPAGCKLHSSMYVQLDGQDNLRSVTVLMFILLSQLEG